MTPLAVSFGGDQKSRHGICLLLRTAMRDQDGNDETVQFVQCQRLIGHSNDLNLQ